MTGPQAEITIALDLRSDDFSGAVRTEAEERRFIGWLGLIDALQHAADEARAGEAGSTDRGRSS